MTETGDHDQDDADIYIQLVPLFNESVIIEDKQRNRRKKKKKH